MLGTGRANVAEIADMARSTLADGLPSKALEAFASLGSGGIHSNNQERDLHRWLHSLFGMSLSTFKVPMSLNVFGRRSALLCLRFIPQDLHVNIRHVNVSRLQNKDRQNKWKLDKIWDIISPNQVPMLMGFVM